MLLACVEAIYDSENIQCPFMVSVW